MIVDGIAASCLDSVDYLLGRLALTLGRREEAAVHLLAAVEQTGRLGARLLRAHAEHALGTALAATDPDGASQLRSGAERVLRAAGATPLIVFGPASDAEPAREEPVGSAFRAGVFHQDGHSWTLSFEGRTVRLPDAKGLHDLRHLLARPGTPVPATALQSDGDPAGARSSRGIDMLDDQARDAYRRRLDELAAEIADAEAMGDTVRAERARDEREFLVAELSAAVGLGGRSRRMGDDADRARKAVTMRIRNALARIERAHPALGRHLSLAVRTGTLCSYEPEQPVTWTL